MIRINGEPVDPALIEETFTRIKAEAEIASEVSCCERDGEFRARAEEEVIEGILLAQEAERRVPEPAADDVRPALEETLREWRRHGASWDLLDARRAELRAETVSRLRMERFTESLWADLAAPTEDELRSWYGAHLADFRVPASARVLHLVRFPGRDPWDDYAAMTELRRRALAGEDFAELAKAHTQKKGGSIELGEIAQERLLNPFEAMLFSLQEGEVSPVFHYEQAYHLVQVSGVKPATVRRYEDVRAEVEDAFTRERRLRVLKELAARLRGQAVVERAAVAGAGA